jgi:YXWGXW repeat-containing protein
MSSLKRLRMTTAALVVLASLLAGCATAAPSRLYARLRPPRPILEPRIAPPGPGYVWVVGFHRWNGARYIWVPGRWTIPPRANARWRPGHWAHDRRGWYWRDGHWR